MIACLHMLFVSFVIVSNSFFRFLVCLAWFALVFFKPRLPRACLFDSLLFDLIFVNCLLVFSFFSLPLSLFVGLFDILPSLFVYSFIFFTFLRDVCVFNPV